MDATVNHATILPGKCLTKSIVYQATVSTNDNKTSHQTHSKQDSRIIKRHFPM